MKLTEESRPKDKLVPGWSKKVHVGWTRHCGDRQASGELSLRQLRSSLCQGLCSRTGDTGAGGQLSGGQGEPRRSPVSEMKRVGPCQGRAVVHVGALPSASWGWSQGFLISWSLCSDWFSILVAHQYRPGSSRNTAAWLPPQKFQFNWPEVWPRDKDSLRLPQRF